MLRYLSIFLIVACVLPAYGQGKGSPTRGRDGRGKSQSSADEVPTAKTEIVEVPEEVKWDYILWTDSSGKRQMRAKLLSVDGEQLHMEKRDGTVIDVGLNRFCNEDQELVSQLHAATKNNTRKRELARSLPDAVKEALESFPEETTVRRAELVRQRETAFLKAQNGRLLELAFPVNDIRETGEPGVYELTLDFEQNLRGREGMHAHRGVGPSMEPSRKLEPVQSFWSHLVRLSGDEAAWVRKGDQLVVSGKASFVFEPLGDGKGVRPAMAEYWFSWRHQGRILYLAPETPTYTIQRLKSDSTLKDKVEARIAQLKAIEAKENIKPPKSSDPFRD